MDELKPCPFCGSRDVEVVHPGRCWVILCNTCQAEGPTDLGESGAIEAWNTRAEPVTEVVNA